MNKNKSFSLLEIIIVVVILGILSATAIPRYIDFTSQGYAARLNAAKAATMSSVSMYFSKALAKGKLETGTNASFTIKTTGSDTITAFSCTESGNTYYPYPDLGESGAMAKLISLKDKDGNDLVLSVADDIAKASGCTASQSNRYLQRVGTNTTDCYFLYDGSTGDVLSGQEACSL